MIFIFFLCELMYGPQYNDSSICSLIQSHQRTFAKYRLSLDSPDGSGSLGGHTRQ